MTKHKTGLHKKISTIFGDAAIPRNDNTEQLPPDTPVAKSPDYTPPKPPTIQHLLASTPPEPTAKPLPRTDAPKQPDVSGTIVKTIVKNFGQVSCAQYCERIKKVFSASKAGVNTGRQKAMILLMPILVIVFIFAFIRVLNQPSSAKTFTPSATAANADNPVAISGKINWPMPEPYPTTLRDPMQINLPAAGQPGGGNLVVKGIVCSADNPSAVIGSQIVHPGDKISGATVKKINQNNVEFEMNGKTWTQEVQR